ncbi:hypothetical protein [Hymenobacter coalescens]
MLREPFGVAASLVSVVLLTSLAGPLNGSAGPTPVGRPAAFRYQAGYADSLDLNPGGMVLPLGSWSTNQGELPTDRGVVYGSCRQRLGFSSGGFGQYVRLYNRDTGKFVRLSVKPTFRSARENNFCYALPPGRYVLQHYEYTESKVYGGVFSVEPLRKGPIQPQGNGRPLTASRYAFTVRPGALHYVGHWQFDKPGQPVFADAKASADSLLTARRAKLPLATAERAIPQ